MIALTPKRTKVIRRIRQALLEGLSSYPTDPQKAEDMVTAEMSAISKLPMRKVRAIARKL